MKITPSVVIDTPEYYVDHFNGKYDIDKCKILRNLQLESDTEAMNSSLKHLPKPTHIVDFTNNELVIIPDLHLRNDIHTLLLGRNQISHLDGKQLPCNIKNLVLANNNIRLLKQLDGLQHSPKSLKNIVLRGNQVCHLQSYREYVIRLLPQLESLDCDRVTQKDKERAMALESFKISDVKEAMEKGQNVSRDKSMEIMNLVVSKMSEAKRRELNQQLRDATSLAEIARIEKQLSGGV